MRIYEHLSENERKKLNALVKRKKPPSKEVFGHKPKNLSRKEIEELMGVNRDTYKRVKGRVKKCH